MRRKLSRHGDLLFLWLMIVLFIGGAGFALWQTDALRDVVETDITKTMVPLEQIMRGSGASKPINQPIFQPVQQAAQHLLPQEPVIALSLEGRSRAYPLAVLIQHNVVNDEFEGRYIAVTYCPLCNSAVVFDRQISDDYVMQMGVTDKLYNSNFLMYDMGSKSWWHQVSGEAIVGEMAGTRLEMVPSLVVSFETFAERYPDGQVLVGDADDPDRIYTINPYIHYDSSDSPLMSNATYDPRLKPLQRVLAAVVADTPVAYSYAYLERMQVVNADVEGVPVVALWQPGMLSVLDERLIAQSSDIGQAALFSRELDGRVLTFRIEDDAIYDAQTNSQWNIFGEAIAGELEGESLMAYTSFQFFWFAWSSSHPETLVFTQ